MSSVADLVEPSAIERLAIPSNIRLGRELAARGAVEFLEFGPLAVKAKVRINQTRTVELRSQKGKLAWRCTCSSHADVFCKHCVAVALVTWEKAPKRRK